MTVPAVSTKSKTLTKPIRLLCLLILALLMLCISRPRHLSDTHAKGLVYYSHEVPFVGKSVYRTRNAICTML